MIKKREDPIIIDHIKATEEMEEKAKEAPFCSGTALEAMSENDVLAVS
jgi:hypothetical protein